MVALFTAMTLTRCKCLSDLVGLKLQYQVEFASEVPAAADSSALLAKHKTFAKPLPGDVVVFGGAKAFTKTIANAEFYNPLTQKWTATAPLPAAGAGSLATELGIPLAGQIFLGQDVVGKITIPHGKLTINVTANNAELFNPSGPSFGSLGQFIDPRAGYTQTLLPNGMVLITGGIDASRAPTNTAEIFDPATSTFTATGNMTMPRALHTATLLNDGTVLIAGGVTDTANDTTDTAEIYDPTAGTFTALLATMSITVNNPPTSVNVAGHTATLISCGGCAIDGDVLIAGGYEGFASTPSTSGNTAVLYDSALQSFITPTGQMTDSRTFHTATALPGGKVLLAGGIYGQAEIGSGSAAFGIFGGVLNSAEIFDPATETFTCVNGGSTTACNKSMVNSRAGHSAIVFTSGSIAGEVLLAGGMGGKTATTRGHASALKTAELYDPVANKFTTTGSMLSARSAFAAILLQ
ncbi:MAG: hypothetical protein IVW56_02755 [Candidatus Binataceae bacterium]|nr:hypothetical protein [Candidatus Binataceae bacterium]